MHKSIDFFLLRFMLFFYIVLVIAYYTNFHWKSCSTTIKQNKSSTHWINDLVIKTNQIPTNQAYCYSVFQLYHVLNSTIRYAVVWCCIILSNSFHKVVTLWSQIVGSQTFGQRDAENLFVLGGGVKKGMKNGHSINNIERWFYIGFLIDICLSKYV